ncbi:MAG: (deoxy)nucleoside triphosphate pyrophosphohydrolase [Sphingomonadales bacterium]|nr:(deoxy)nucleoside triphosphate pyrophosphohydrolase [Sphingomonadales bacterium]
MLVAAVALLDGGGRVLLQQRRISSEHGGLWEFPGGKVEPGETCAEALVREIAEELGVAVDPGALDSLAFSTRRRTDGREIVLLLYTCREWRGEPVALDAEQVAWVCREALSGLAMPPLDIDLAGSLGSLLK